eukprot:CAMPEP_0175057736 /NCGR_PEP_ID=MMETSP0052_2-20121109/11433_1 /TAXON_ID=51329 ORGANISM="Polytomella parva, Strain SAG 63-3" /NCGR_SAMPLE_ID=MMETSP0052_2 /ASSEMBLY_ACC=CAM_ASM_000194 /LENGTH=555 /DNA_ID=CAMNT_0016322989 /DNA_START=154 /DNA_END=1821 /DNA_ORIENTATION=+
MSLRRKTKLEVAEAFIAQLAQRGDVDINAPGFIQSIKEHFERLPTRYSLDVSIDGLDVLSHKRLLDEARADPSTVSFSVRPVDIVIPKFYNSSCASPTTASRYSRKTSLSRPAFGSSPNLQALALEATERDGNDDSGSNEGEHVIFYEITIASVDQPKLLSRLSEALSDLGLNIREAHAFNTSDSFSLDVFVVDQWTPQAPEQSLEECLGERLLHMPPPPPKGGIIMSNSHVPQPVLRIPEETPPNMASLFQSQITRPDSPVADDWEIDITQLNIEAKVASGAFSNLYKGTYCGQDVAVKILKDIQDDSTQYQEFVQEVSIMRKVRHKNVVQFIGACTRKPNLCIVFEFMSGGSVYDYIRREGQMKLSMLLKIAVDVARGMDYLHQRKIIHRDLKAANLLLDENNIVKIADFGVARIIEHNGNMTAETGTYRWMAPEVIEHRPYDEKADVFSFAVVLWELFTCKVPYSDMTPLQAAVGVVQKGLRPGIPPNCPPALAAIMESCWVSNPQARPSFRDIVPKLQLLLDATREEELRKQQQNQNPHKQSSLFSKLRGK